MLKSLIDPIDDFGSNCSNINWLKTYNLDRKIRDINEVISYDMKQQKEKPKYAIRNFHFIEIYIKEFIRIDSISAKRNKNINSNYKMKFRNNFEILLEDDFADIKLIK
jgi:hypothetical protein